MPKKLSPELRGHAVRMAYDRRAREGGPYAASIRAVAPQLGAVEETLRIWHNRYGPTEPAGPCEGAPQLRAQSPVAVRASRCRDRRRGLPMMEVLTLAI